MVGLGRYSCRVQEDAFPVFMGDVERFWGSTEPDSPVRFTRGESIFSTRALGSIVEDRS